MDNKSISVSIKEFLAKQCESPIVGSRIKEAIETVRELKNESSDSSDTSQYQRRPSGSGSVGAADE